MRTCLVAGLMFVSAAGWALAIPADEQDMQRIFAGNPSAFDSPAEVDYRAVVRATSEYEAIQNEQLTRGDARYWILISDASDRALNAISAAAMDSEYDLIAASGYLGSLTEPVNCPNITEDVIGYLN